MNDPMIFFKLLVYMSPVILMFIMLGNAVMSGTPIVFLIYLGFLYLSVALRMAIYYLGTSVTKSTSSSSSNVTECPMDNYLYTPIASYKYRANLSTFLFAFTIFYMFFPSGQFYLNSSSQLSMFLILIIYCVYDIVMRSIMSANFPACNESTRIKIFKSLSEMVMGSALGFLSSTSVVGLGMGNYLYYSKNKNTPTKKVFRCGTIKK